jgi:hypothetical protein
MAVVVTCFTEIDVAIKPTTVAVPVVVSPQPAPVMVNIPLDELLTAGATP